MAEPFDGVIETTAAESTPAWPAAVRPAPDAPNVVVIVLDDTGYADLGCFGSEIATPNIDRLAANGSRYSGFHTTPLCSPTRASLLTGRNPHNAGMRFLSEIDSGYPNCRGRISGDAATVAQVLVERGYRTMAVGKWHLAPPAECTPVGPFHNWPLGKGFQRYYGFLRGVSDQYLPDLVLDNQCIDNPVEPGYHLTEDLVTKAMELVGDLPGTADSSPFFLYLALAATHAPHQVPPEYVEKYVDVFRKGWDRTREERLQRQKELGIVPPGTQLTERNEGVPAWDSLTADEQEAYARMQAAYAGFLEHTDEQIGRLLDFLERAGYGEDTAIFLLSDNGASDQGGRGGAANVMFPYNGLEEGLERSLEEVRAPEFGAAPSASIYPSGWAMAGNTPFRRYKMYVDGGGVNTPLIVSWPGRIREAGGVRSQFLHAIDVAPTILEMAGVDPPAEVSGRAQKPLDGASFLATFGEPEAPTRQTQYFECMGHRGIWRDGWKALTHHAKGADYREEPWRLYHVADDVSESVDLAAEQPEKLDELVAAWWEEAERASVFPLDDRTLTELLDEQGYGMPADGDFVYHPDARSYWPVAGTPALGDRSFTIRAELADAADGVVVAAGTETSGYALYVQDGRPVFEYNCLGDRTLVAAERALPSAPAVVELRFRRTGVLAGRASLHVDGDEVAAGEIPRLLHFLSFRGLQVGRNRYSPVSRAFAGEFAFRRGALRRVVLSVD